MPIPALTPAHNAVTTAANNEFIGNPDVNTSRAIPSWSNKAFFIPTVTSSSHRVGFTSDPDGGADVDTSGFIFYEDTALHLNADHSLSSLWYVLPTRYERVWSLHWNATGDGSDGRVAVKLRSVPPAKPWDHGGLEERTGLWFQGPET